jgi:glycosyltransferase involved in cell wall biosynthesis
LALDATYSAGEPLTGVGVYSRELLWGLAAAYPGVRFQFRYRPHRILKSLRTPLPQNARRCLLLGSPGRASLFHALNQRLDFAAAMPTAVTFHDLFVMTGEYSSAEFRARFTAQAREAAARADLLIAVSEFTAGQIRECLGVDAGRIRVVPHGVHVPAEVPGEESRENVILTVGTIQKRKNLIPLVEAFEQVDSTWRLVMAGAQGWQSEETLARMEASPARARIQVTGFVSDSQLRALYARARIFCFPSLDEGFGIPVLEAMAWGVPVIASNRSAVPEAAGGAGLLLDPRDAGAWRHALRTWTASPELRAEYAQRGRHRAHAATWQAAVRNTWKVYRELVPGLEDEERSSAPGSIPDGGN